MDATAAQSSERTIPLIEIDSAPPIALVEAAPDSLADIMRIARRRYTPLGMRLGDAFSKAWLVRAGNPYLKEIADIAERVGKPGAFLLNLSYEWTCTSAVSADPEHGGNRLVRTLDWPLEGLGRNVVISRQRGMAGEYYNVTWPGFAGVLTAMAPGRFSAAINQPPMRRYTFSCWLDWIVERYHLNKRKALPPAHLLRHVFDTCETFEAAKQALIETPINMPAFFSLSGAHEDEGCVIERTENDAHVHEGPFCMANHWLGLEEDGRLRGYDSHGRRALMDEHYETAPNDFSWVHPPILNTATRLAVIANAAKKKLMVQGLERDGAATKVFKLGA